MCPFWFHSISLYFSWIYILTFVNKALQLIVNVNIKIFLKIKVLMSWKYLDKSANVMKILSKKWTKDSHKLLFYVKNKSFLNIGIKLNKTLQCLDCARSQEQQLLFCDPVTFDLLVQSLMQHVTYMSWPSLTSSSWCKPF